MNGKSGSVQTTENYNPLIISEASTFDEEKSAELDQSLTRNAHQILETIINAMPKIAGSLKIQSNRERVSHEIDIPGLDKYSTMILASYAITKGDKERTIYFALLQAPLQQRLEQLLSNNIELLKKLTHETINIQFACPKTHKAFQFKRRKKELFGKAVYVEEFNIN